jgi:hypothetical protein
MNLAAPEEPSSRVMLSSATSLAPPRNTDLPDAMRPSRNNIVKPMRANADDSTLGTATTWMTASQQKGVSSNGITTQKQSLHHTTRHGRPSEEFSPSLTSSRRYKSPHSKLIANMWSSQSSLPLSDPEPSRSGRPSKNRQSSCKSLLSNMTSSRSTANSTTTPRNQGSSCR